MRLLFLAYVHGRNHQLLRKIESQVAALRTVHSESFGVVVGEEWAEDISPENGVEVINCAPLYGVFEARRMSRVRIRLFEEAVAKYRPDRIILRYSYHMDSHWADFVARQGNVVLEHHTKELQEIEFQKAGSGLAQREKYYGPSIRQAACGLIAVTRDILEFETSFSNLSSSRATCVIGNGIDVNKVETLPPTLSDGVFEFLIAARFSRWHGYDRILDGLKDFADRRIVRFHFAGDGEELERYRAFVRTQGLEDVCTFHGYLDADGLSRVASKCHAAIGSLGLHRMGLKQLSVLKNRQYCAQGLPLVFAGEDPDFPSELPWVLSLPADDSPVDLSRLVSFAQNQCLGDGLRASIRQYAEEHLDWSVKMRHYADFLKRTKPQNSPRSRKLEPEKRVLFVAHGPNQLNGPNVWLMRLLPDLQARGWDVGLALVRTGPEECFVAGRLDQAGVSCFMVDWDQTETTMQRLIELCRQYRPHVFVPHLDVPAYFASRWLKQAGIATVGVIHSDDPFYTDLIEEFSGDSNSDYLSGIVAVSQFLTVRTQSAKLAPNSPLATIPCGAPLPKKRVERRPGEPFRLLYAGRLADRQKRITDVTTALIRATREIPNVEATIIGHGPEKEKVLALLETEKGHRVTYAGTALPHQLPGFFENAHALVLLSDFEGLSIALMEAMAGGLVPICTRVESGHSELVEHESTGIYVRDRGDDFVAQVRRLASDPTGWDKISRQARKRIIDGYSSEACHRQWDTFLNRLAETTELKPISVPALSEICLPPRRTTPHGMGREDFRRLTEGDQPPPATVAKPVATPPVVDDADIPSCDLRICLVRAHHRNYSETFIEDHQRNLSSDLTVLHGYPYPRFRDSGESVLSPAEEKTLDQNLGKPAGGDAYTAGLARFFKEERFDVVLVETGLMGAFVYRACLAAEQPFVVHFHGADAHVGRLIDPLRLDYFAQFRSAASIVGVSKVMVNALLSLGAPEEKTVLGPYGVSVDGSTIADPSANPPHFLAVGRLVEKKAPLKTIEAFSLVAAACPEARLVFVGDGPLMGAAKHRVAQLGLERAVDFLGVKAPTEIAELRSRMRAFVQHSVVAPDGDSEGLPLAILEAGASGLPVVSTRHAGIPDAVVEGEHGFLVEEGDAESMGRAMLQLAQDPALAAQLGGAFREHVAERYCQRVAIGRLQGILRRAAETGRQALAEARKPLSIEQIEFQRASVCNVGQCLQLASEARRIDASALEADLLFQALGYDRSRSDSYLRLAHHLLSQGKKLDAWLCLREAERESDLPAPLQRIEKSLRNDPEVTDDPLTEVYLAHSGRTKVERADRRLRILVYTNLLPPQEMGGYGRTVWEFSNLLHQRGHEVLVLTANMPHLKRSATAAHQRFEKHVRRTLTLFGDWKGGQAIAETDEKRIMAIAQKNQDVVAKAIDRFKPDVAMAGNLDFLSPLPLYETLKRGIPVLHRLGNALPGYPLEAMPKSSRYCIAGCSEWLNTGLREQGFAPGRFEVVYPGSPIERYYRLLFPTFDRLRICFAGLLQPYKGPQVLMKALALLHRMGIPFTCEFAGDTTDPKFVESLKQIASQGEFQNAVKFPGFLSQDGLAALYARSNVMVFPSVFEEPFGKSQIEAMAAGLPVLSSGTGGSREIVQDDRNGLIFENNNPEDLARQLFVLQANQELWGKLAAQAQADAFRFTTLNSVLKIESIFRELLKKS